MPMKGKPDRCPFCGGVARYGKVGDQYRVWCKKCLTATRGFDRAHKAIELWNKRRYRYFERDPIFTRTMTLLPPDNIVAVVGTKAQLQRAGLSMKGYGKTWFAYHVLLDVEDDASNK